MVQQELLVPGRALQRLQTPDGTSPSGPRAGGMLGSQPALSSTALSCPDSLGSRNAGDVPEVSCESV